MEGNTQVKTSEPLISVIVPVYNVEAYLRECVDSIIHQTYQNLEVILVDDGSPDNCGKICDEYAERDSRIVVIHKPNGGLSDARNAGMAVMHGEFLIFVDSDDKMTHDGISILYQTYLQTNADIVIGGVEKFDDETKEIIWTDTSDRLTTFTREEAIKDFFQNGCASWARLYKRSVHEGVLFPVGEINEDEAIVLRLLERCERVAKISEIVYEYRWRSASITSTKWSRKKLAWCNHCKENLTFIKKSYPELTNYAQSRYRGSLIWSLTEIAMVDDMKDYEADKTQMLSELKQNDKLFRKLLFGSGKEKLRYFVLSHLGFNIYRLALRTKRG